MKLIYIWLNDILLVFGLMIKNNYHEIIVITFYKRYIKIIMKLALIKICTIN